MSHLPSLGCPKCAFADPPKRMALDDGCACDDLFLNPLTDQQWQRNKGTWFRRQRRGRDWFTSVLSEISKKAGLSKVYTNSCMRPTVVTELLKAGYDSRQVMTFTGHKTTAMVQHYSRQLEGMQKEGKKKASALLTPSGRNKLRGADKNVKKVFCTFHLIIIKFHSRQVGVTMRQVEVTRKQVRVKRSEVHKFNPSADMKS